MPIFECARCNDLTYSASADAVRPCDRCGESRHRVFEGGFDDARHARRDLCGSDHAALVYDDVGRIAPFCARYVTDGVNAGQRVMAALPDDLRAAVEHLLAPDVAVVIDWHEPSDVYGDFDADRIAAMYDALIASEPRTTRILAAVDQACAEGVDPAELDRYEAAAHEIIAGHGAIAVCMYDARTLDDAYLGVASRRHPLDAADGVVRRNERFEYVPA